MPKLFEAKSVVICPPGGHVGVAEGVPVGVGVGVCVAVGVAVGVNVAEGEGLDALGDAVAVGVGVAPPRLKAPIRNRHPIELVVGTYSLTTQKVWSSVGSISIDE